MPKPPLQLPKEWTPPRLLAWQREALEHGWFDFAVPKFAWLVTKQAAQALSLSITSVQDLADIGALETRTKDIKGARKELLISRRSILLYLASKTQTDPRDFATKCVELIRAIACQRTLTLLHQAIAQELK